MCDHCDDDSDTKSVLNVHIQKLEKISQTVKLEGGEVMRMLFNPATYEYCQIFELYCEAHLKNCDCKHGEQCQKEFVPNHLHRVSDELFYIIKGKLTFNDGEVLETGQSRIVKAGTAHGGHLDTGSKAIIILRPPDPQYDRLRTDSVEEFQHDERE